MVLANREFTTDNTITKRYKHAGRRDDAGRACRDTEHKASGRLPRRTPPHATPHRYQHISSTIFYDTLHNLKLVSNRD